MTPTWAARRPFGALPDAAATDDRDATGGRADIGGCGVVLLLTPSMRAPFGRPTIREIV